MTIFEQLYWTSWIKLARQLNWKRTQTNLSDDGQSELRQRRCTAQLKCLRQSRLSDFYVSVWSGSPSDLTADNETISTSIRSFIAGLFLLKTEDGSNASAALVKTWKAIKGTETCQITRLVAKHWWREHVIIQSEDRWNGTRTILWSRRNVKRHDVELNTLVWHIVQIVKAKGTPKLDEFSDPEEPGANLVHTENQRS